MAHPDDIAREQLAFSIRFALVHKIVARDTKRALRALPDGHVDAMAATIAEHLFLSGWRNPPKPVGPGAMHGMPRPED
jgi:hypothetical protein